VKLNQPRTQKFRHSLPAPLVFFSRRPGMIVSDNGTEFASMAILRWCQERGVG
jgi:transposase InsO family protein